VADSLCGHCGGGAARLREMVEYGRQRTTTRSSWAAIDVWAGTRAIPPTKRPLAGPIAIAWPAMPRSFDFSVESPASVEQIHSAFSDEDYWLARLAAFGGPGLRLDSLIIGTDGSVHVIIIQDLRHDGLPGLFAKLYRRDLQVVQKETWSPTGGGRVRGEICIAARGAPGSGLGEVLLAPAQNGSRLKCTATVEFKVPLVGGKIESLIGRQLVEQISVVQNFTTKWITERA
jgi:hypothetical protein